jgi:hypothetical protein
MSVKHGPVRLTVPYFPVIPTFFVRFVCESFSSFYLQRESKVSDHLEGLQVEDLVTRPNDRLVCASRRIAENCTVAQPHLNVILSASITLFAHDPGHAVNLAAGFSCFPHYYGSARRAWIITRLEIAWRHLVIKRSYKFSARMYLSFSCQNPAHSEI